MHRGLYFLPIAIPCDIELILKYSFLRFEKSRFAIEMSNDITVFVPKEYWELKAYRATLGHKLNHSFKKGKMTLYKTAFHPRHGVIIGVMATERIKKVYVCNKSFLMSIILVYTIT